MAERPTFDSLLVELLVHCLQPAPDRLESRIQAALRRCVAFLEVDCGSLSLAPLQPGDLPLNLAYEEPGVLLPDFEATRQRFPWLTQAGGRGGKILLPRPAGRMGSDAQTVTEREFATQTGICACALLPIEVTGGGWLRFLSVRRPREWPEELVERLGALGTVLATAWRREQAAAGHMTVPHQAAQQRPSAADASPAVRDSAEGQAAEASTASQLRFERLISSISARIGKVEPWEVNREIQRGLSALREFFTVDRCRLLGVSPDRQSLEVIETCAAERAAPLPPGHPGFAQAFPWMFRQVVHAGHCLSLPRLDQLPEAACQDRAACQRQNLQSVFLIPLSVSGAVRFVLSLVAVQQPHMWLEEYIPRLRLLGEIFVNALARKQTEEKIRQSEDFNRTVLASLQDHVAILDRAGNILAVNEAWVNFGRANNAPTGSLGVGWNYLAACQHAADDDPDAAAALQGIETVLQGTQPEFLFDYRCDSPQEQRWFEMVVQPLRRPEGGAVISHTNVTRQRKAELEAQRLRQEITHVARVSMMGELTAALAHELKQPLAAILGNTQAAQRLLASDPPDLVEIRDILADIVADDQRAGEIIHRLRGFLTKSTFQPQPLSLNTLSLEVVRLIRSDARNREVAIALDLAPDLPLVLGDRIQLQQVLLNLIINAMDALKANPPAERKLVVRSSQPQPDKVQVSVQDCGVGLPADQGDRVFEPFFTTKTEGLGMGLAICRAIVQAHHGQIGARNNLDRGSTFQFTLPLTGAPPSSEPNGLGNHG